MNDKKTIKKSEKKTIKKGKEKRNSAHAILNGKGSPPAPPTRKKNSLPEGRLGLNKSPNQIAKASLTAVFKLVSSPLSKRKKKKESKETLSFDFEEDQVTEFGSDDEKTDSNVTGYIEDSSSTDSNETHYVEDNWTTDEQQKKEAKLNLQILIRNLPYEECKKTKYEADKDKQKIRSTFFELNQLIEDDKFLRCLINSLDKQNNEKIIFLLSGPYKKNDPRKEEANKIIQWALFKQTSF